jgi:hypothetical protein
VGVDEPGFVPPECRAPAPAPPADGPTTPPGPGGGGPAGSNGQCTTTAADRHGWGRPGQEDGFDGSSIGDTWTPYNGPGHGGNGRRTSEAISVADGQLTITGSENGDAGGMSWGGSQQYGRWEGCVRSPAPAADSLHTLLLLWPTEENWPVGGEVDFMEISDGARKKVEGFLHFGEDNSQTHGEVALDATQWHAFAVEWTPEKITYFADGEPWFTDTERSHNPPGPMHLTVQLDYFGGDASGGAEMNVDWVRQWPLEGATTETSPAGSAAGGARDGAGDTTSGDSEGGSGGNSGSDSDSDPGGSRNGSGDPGDSGGSGDRGGDGADGSDGGA